MITFSNELQSKETMLLFEQQHHENLQWGYDVKVATYNIENSCFIYMFVDEVIVGELVLTWISIKSLEVDSFTVLPEARGHGYGNVLLMKAVEYAVHNGFFNIHATAKQPISSGIFLKMGFIAGELHMDWAETGEEFLSVNLTLRQ